MAYKTGSRKQMDLFPSAIENYVSDKDPVRAYDAFVEALDLGGLGISIEPYKAGAHEYYPEDMLKLIIYGTSYGVKGSRKLERACYHNLSFMWIMGGLKPDHRTISRFRTEYKEAIKKILKQCVHMCIELSLIDGNVLFTDGSFFRANASIGNTWTKERCEKHIKKITERIDRMVDEGERIDKEEEQNGSLIELKKELRTKEQLKEKIQQIVSNPNEPKKSSINTTDPDCVKTKGRQGTHAGYNAQITVDEKHGLIVNSETTSKGTDANQFSAQVKQATDVLDKNPEVVSSDSGYYSLEDLEKVDNKITVVMPSRKQAQEEHGHPLNPFDKDNFIYNTKKDEYTCPQGKELKYTGNSRNSKKHKTSTLRRYKANAKECLKCTYFGVCTKSPQGRRIERCEQEELKYKLETIYKSKQGRDIYKLRKQKVELPFGHMKRNLQAGQFLSRGKKGTDAELAILSTCFNIARMITIIGVPALISKFNGL